MGNVWFLSSLPSRPRFPVSRPPSPPSFLFLFLFLLLPAGPVPSGGAAEVSVRGTSLPPPRYREHVGARGAGKEGRGGGGGTRLVGLRHLRGMCGFWGCPVGLGPGEGTFVGLGLTGGGGGTGGLGGGWGRTCGAWVSRRGGNLGGWGLGEGRRCGAVYLKWGGIPWGWGAWSQRFGGGDMGLMSLGEVFGGAVGCGVVGLGCNI